MSASTPCKNIDELHSWILTHTGLRVPRNSVCPHHQSPMEYLATAYFEPSQDQIVWAPRGGGKTTLAAVATLLDLLHKPECSVRILGGSLDQSLRMWDTLLAWFEDQEELTKLVKNPKGTARRLRLNNKSFAAVLTQSQKSVRGLRVQKLRCDEVEMFDPDVWSAAQLVTRSRQSQEADSLPVVRGTIEALSTFHKAHGLMRKIVDQAVASGTKVVRWCLLDVLEKCPPERACAACPLWAECQGIAKTRCEGFFRIDDAIAMKSRVSEDVWQSEMLCLRPSTRGSVFPMLETARHVQSEPPFPLEVNCEWWLAIDFGFSAPLVCLWIAVRGEEIYVVDEHVMRERTLEQHIALIEARDWPRVPRIACDPAGGGRNEQTAASNIQILTRRGYKVRTCGSKIVDGIELIRAALRSASGQTRLTIHPRCVQLLSAMSQYRYANDASELPLKDGENDHAVDALRYFFINQKQKSARARAY